MNLVRFSARALTGAVLFAGATLLAQTPTGSIVGAVTDPSGATILEAHITIVNRDTGVSRKRVTGPDGTYSAVALPSGVYQITAEATGFRRLERVAIVEAGTTTTLNLTLQLGEVAETVTVKDDVLPLIRYDHHQVGGLVSRAQIENLPLNGRNFLELAKLEPGVANPVRGTNNRIFVPTLGAGLQTSPRIGYTRVTVDGASINAVGTIGATLQVSQDVVREFQISTVNFDLSTSLTSNGAINIVTRSGGNDYHGSGFYFYRDHNLAAYPGLQRDPSNPDPFFQRRQFGYQLGGPIRKDRAFFFTSYERNTSAASSRFSRALPSLLHSEVSSPVPISAISSTCASTCHFIPTTAPSPATRTTVTISSAQPGRAVLMLFLRAGPASPTGSIRA